MSYSRPMERSLLYNLAALAALLPAALVDYRARERPDGVIWVLLGVAAAGSASWAGVLLGGHWLTGFAAALWVSIAVTLVVFIALVAVSAHAWRLTPLLLPYLLLLGGVATVWAQTAEGAAPGAPATAWLNVHIVVSVLTYALLTIAAIAGFAVLVHERALKRKRPRGITQVLPSIADSEALELRLLIAGEIVLGAGLLTGVATRYANEGILLALDHKTLLSVLAFTVIGALLFARWRTGVRGRRAAHFVLAAYLLLTLAYPGVKFVTDVLLA